MSVVARFLTSFLESDSGLGAGEVFLKLDGSVWLVMPGGAQHQLGVTSGGGTGAVVRGPFPIAFNTAGLTNGVVVYTPTVGDHLLDALIVVETAFDGTTPKADIGTFVGQNTGLFSAVGNGVIDLTLPADEAGGAGLLVSANAAIPGSLVGANAYNGSKSAWGVFSAANPIKVVVSQTGQKGGASPGAAHGAASVYLVTATPAS